MSKKIGSDVLLTTVILAGTWETSSSFNTRPFDARISRRPYFTINHGPGRFLSAPYAKSSFIRHNMVAETFEDIIPLSDSCILTPEGFGFSAPAERILKLKSGLGYYRTTSTERVIDVMEAVSAEGRKQDVALIFEDENSDNLLGIFTEADYVEFSKKRAKDSNTEEESASFLLSPVIDFATPASKIVCITTGDTASKAIAAMTQEGLRHLVVVDKVLPGNIFSPESIVEGVINMQDVMSVVQKDERLSLTSLSKKFPGLSDPFEMLKEETKSFANEMASDPEVGKQDLVRSVVVTVFSAAAIGLFISHSPWLQDHADLAMIGIFILGYIGIIFEEVFEFNKASIALLMSTGMWVTYADYFAGATGTASKEVLAQLGETLSEVSEICFFLLAASTIVEVVDAHQGFKVVTNLITTKSKKTLFWTIGFLTFFLSAILNNLTVTIVMVSLLRKLIPQVDDRRFFGAMVVVAANAGGVWTPIGDVTTTMLWINNQLSTIPTITELFIPSVVCLVGSLAFLVNKVDDDSPLESPVADPSPLALRGQVVFWFGIACLIGVPVFSELTGLPPYIAMLTGLGAMWTLTDILHVGEENKGLKVPAALSKLDTSGILFFLGILMSIGVLDKSGLLKNLAVYLSENLPSLDIIATVIGVASALIDNVPLVAATMGMYDLSEYGTDDRLWQLIALCAGTGGSILIIGSASGVALMGLEKVDFIWYAKNVSLGAAVGYFAGVGTYIAQSLILKGDLFGAALPAMAQASDVVHSLSGVAVM